MKLKAFILAFALVFAMSTLAIAVTASKELVFEKSPMGKVTFSGKAHSQFKCTDCHNPDMFPKKKQGTVSIMMAKIYAGRLCGKCHDGKTAFKAMSACNRCHKK